MKNEQSKAPILSLDADKTKFLRAVYDRAINWNHSYINICNTSFQWHKLVEAYGRPVSTDGSIPRTYHNIDHIANGLDSILFSELEMQAAEHRDLRADFLEVLEDFECLVIAWFYHDYNYLVGVPGYDNEKESEISCAEDLRAFSWTKPKIDKVCHLISLTKHDVNPKDYDVLGNIIVDTDLLGLSLRSKHSFDENTNNVRQEFRMYSDEEWRAGRLKFFQDLLERKEKRILRSEFFSQFNSDAVENINREIKWYSSRIRS